MYVFSQSNAHFPRSRSIAVALLVISTLLLGILNFQADAAPEQPTIALTEIQGAIRVQGKAFAPTAVVSVVGEITGGTGRGTVTSRADGSFDTAIAVPEWQTADQMRVTAIAGTSSATATIALTPKAVTSPSPGPSVPTTGLPAASSPTTAAIQAAGPRPNGPGGNWRLIFGDDFSGSALDANKWATCYHWGCDGANKQIEVQKYNAANVKVGGGKVAFIASPGGSASGMIAQKQQYAFKYGYMEMRAQMPKCAGCWPAFWSIPDDLTWPPEIDVMEGLTDDTTQAMTNYHWGVEPNQKQSGAKLFQSPTDLAAAYHTYGAEWTPERITWYIDGRKVNEFTDASVIANVPMYVVANLAIDGSRGKGTAPAGAQMNVDFIRVWQRA